MLPGLGRTLRVLMTVDAVGGVWRYAMTLAEALRPLGVETVFAGLGPAPSRDQRSEAERLGTLRWLGAPLDWMAAAEADLDGLADELGELSEAEKADLLHLNVPSQACGLAAGVPAVVVSHSCVATWWHAVRATALPEDWEWQRQRSLRGFARADAIVAPSRSHAALARSCYGADLPITVVANAAAALPAGLHKEPIALAAGRWWDEGKNGRVLDAAAAASAWPIIVAGALEGPNGERSAFAHAQPVGQLDGERMQALIGRAGIVMSPSLYEPFGLAALEAAGAEAALVLSEIPTYRELWEGAALFARADDPQHFAFQINALARDPRLRRRLGRRARRRAQWFTPTLQAQTMAAVYGQASAARSAPVAAAR